ncbi:GNAT family N-acetyltransferase [Streptomyces sp. NPDC006430]|uniref:GNAT family N-acetyltransferase n=1 Tax=Streptomyces sp. NPDC006430 TaxID=3154299 RepID=UPI00339F5C50
MGMVLREVRDSDLDVFWEQFTDPEIQYMTAVTRAYHYDRARFDTHWAKVRSDPAVTLRTVEVDGVVVGHAAVFGPPQEREVTYLIGRAHWGHGLATQALSALLRLEDTRPLHGAAVADNAGSLRVMEKCGFTATGRIREFADARGEEVDLVLLTLDRPVG